MNSSIFVPKTINVGYQNRSGTYTGKLAYVIYYDEKGKLRKEASWNSWRDDKIPNDEFENVPTEGFVLNKKAGDYSTGWDHRHAYCRVYDPRGFEFEITIENLLYILENANCIKGKGLEGEFIYGWDGKDLVLMPVESPDYKQIAAYNKIVHNNESIKTRDLILGATYLTKENIEYIKQNYGEEYLTPLIVSKNLKHLQKTLPYLQSIGVLETIKTSASILSLTLEEIKERKAFIESIGEPIVKENKFNSIFGMPKKSYPKKVKEYEEKKKIIADCRKLIKQVVSPSKYIKLPIKQGKDETEHYQTLSYKPC